MSETDVQRNVLRRAIRHDAIAWICRNNVGAYKKQGIWVKYGLGKGSSDLIGQLKDGRFLAMEVKTETGTPSKEQILFINRVIMWGGVAGIVRCPDDVDNLIEAANGTKAS